MKGFKSFPDRTRLEFLPGVNVVVGPNGAGKSNVAEAILWCMGEQSPLAVRGQTMQDVIFSGSHGVPSRRSAEVELVLDNSDACLPIEFSEVSIGRRMDRSGEGEYRLNGARCRLIDVLELFSDTGLGKEMHSVVSQGSVEEIVHSKPEQRRLVIEEAAGLGKHRKRRRRAELKIERTRENLDRALDVEREARSVLRPLKRQAEAAEYHKRLERQSLELKARLVADDLREMRARLGSEEGRAREVRGLREEVERKLAAVAKKREEAERRLTEKGSERELLTRAYFGAQAAAENIHVWLEQSREVVEALTDELSLIQESQQKEEARQAQLRIHAGPRRRDPGEPPPDPVEGARWLLGDLKLEGESAELARVLLDDVWIVESLDSLPDDFQGTAITPSGWVRLAGERGTYRFVGEDGFVEKVDAGQLASLERERQELVGRRDSAEAVVEALAALVNAAEAQRERFERQFERSRDQGTETTRELRELAGSEHALQAELRQVHDSVTEREVKAAQVRESEADLTGELDRIGGMIGLELEVGEEPLSEEEREDVERKIERLARRRDQLGPVNPLAKDEYREALEHVDDLKAQREDLETALKELKGLIRDTDRLIKEKFEETFAGASKNFKEVVSHLFPGGDGSIRLVESSTPRQVFGGAEEPPSESSGDDEDEAASENSEVERQELGVEVEVTPAGKVTRRLSLLSGGEKSLVAMAFLFAVFMARPCPFYVLDEVEAALDDVNIDRFLTLLRRFSDQAQFIVITHQRRSMDAADALYGVSMGDDGISRVVSRKLEIASELDKAEARAA